MRLAEAIFAAIGAACVVVTVGIVLTVIGVGVFDRWQRRRRDIGARRAVRQ